MPNNESCGYVSLLYSIADKPLELWSKYVSLGGKIRRVKDNTLYGDRVIEVTGPYDSTIPTNITIPAKALDILNIKLPVLVFIVKNLNLEFKLEVQIIDKKQHRRRFSFMTYNLEKLPRIDASLARIPLKLEESWNTLEINLQTLCREVYGTDYKALQRIIVYPNCHLRRIYLQDRHYNYDETPIEMCQAFFDMYLSKRGINFTERACQTEKHYTGSLEQSELNCIDVKDEPVSASTIKIELSKNAYSIEKLKSLNLLNTAIKKSNVHFTNAKSRISTSSFPFASKNKVSENIKFDKKSNTFDTLNTEIQMTKDRYMKKHEQNNANLRSTINVEARAENISEHIPLEKVKLNEVKSQSTYLTTDTAMLDFMAACRSVLLEKNRKLLEKLRDNGLITPQIELLIYNMKNQRNSYGYETFIEKQRWCIDKCIE